MNDDSCKLSLLFPSILVRYTEDYPKKWIIRVESSHETILEI
jgi:hypothetical protein